MLNMYAKLFSRIAQSSLMEESIETRYCFMMLLAIADSAGDVIGTDVAIARTLNLDLPLFQTCIKELMEPDADSNSQEREGRRVIASENGRGYHLVNYTTYRAIKTNEEKKAYMRDYMRQRRKGLTPKSVTYVNSGKIPLSDVTQSESESESESEAEREGGETAIADDLKESVNPSAARIENAIAPHATHPPPDDESAAVASLMTSGIPTEFGRYVYADWSSRDGRDGSNVQVRFVPYAVKRWTREQVEWRSGLHKGNKSNGAPISKLPTTFIVPGMKKVFTSDTAPTFADFRNKEVYRDQFEEVLALWNIWSKKAKEANGA